jgi:hypothetical protein
MEETGSLEVDADEEVLISTVHNLGVFENESEGHGVSHVDHVLGDCPHVHVSCQIIRHFRKGLEIDVDLVLCFEFFVVQVFLLGVSGEVTLDDVGDDFRHEILVRLTERIQKGLQVVFQVSTRRFDYFKVSR